MLFESQLELCFTFAIVKICQCSRKILLLFYSVIQKNICYWVSCPDLTGDVVFKMHTHFQQINIHSSGCEGMSTLVFDRFVGIQGKGSRKLICISYQPYFSALWKILWKSSLRTPPWLWLPAQQSVGWELQTVSSSGPSPQASLGNCWASSADVPSSAALDSGHCLFSRSFIFLLLLISLSAEEEFRYEFSWELMWAMLCLCRTSWASVLPHHTHWRPPMVAQGGGVHTTRV